MITGSANAIGSWYRISVDALVNSYVSRVEADGGVTESAACLKDRITTLRTLGMWDKATAIWLPHGYKEGKLYAAKGGANADLSISRAGTRTRKGPTYVEQVPYNLVSNCNDLTASGWIKLGTPNVTLAANATTAPDGTQTATRMTAAAGNTGVRHTSSSGIGGHASTSYTLEFWARSDNGATLSYDVHDAGTTSTVLTTTWTKYTLTATPTSSLGTSLFCDLVFVSPTGGVTTCDIWGVQVVVGSSARDLFRTTNRQNVPALDYTNDTCPALSLEPARTNLLLQSEAFDNASWTKTASTITANTTPGVDNLSTADSLLETTAVDIHRVSQTITKAASSVQYALTVYAKPLGRDYIWFRVHDGAGNGIKKFFNITTGVVGNTALLGTGFTFNDARITLTTNGLYRVEFVYTTNTATTNVIDIATSTDGVSESFAGDTTKGLYLQGAQLEAGSYATSYIPTTTATVSRIADTVNTLWVNKTNFLQRSEDLHLSPWSATDVTITQDAIAGPSEIPITSADLVTNSAGTTAELLQNVAIIANQTYTFSGFFKASVGSIIQLRFCQSTLVNNAVIAWFNISNGTTGTVTNSGTGSGATASVVSYGGGWYRFTLSGAINNGATNGRVFIRMVNSDANSSTTVGHAYYATGLQLNGGTTLSDYYRTDTTTGHDGSVIGQTEGTLYFDGSSFADGTVKEISISDGSTANYIAIRFNASNNIQLLVTQGGVVSVNLSGGAFVSGTNYKIAVTYSGSRAAFTVNGVTVEDLVVVIPACHQIRFSTGSGTLPFYGECRGLALSPIVISDAEAISWTTP